MKVLKIFVALLTVPVCQPFAQAQRTTANPMILINKMTATNACLEEYFNLSTRIYRAVWSGKIKAYPDNTFQTPYHIDELNKLTTLESRRMLINPLNPGDPYDIIERVEYTPYDPYSVVSMETKGDAVHYRFYTATNDMGVREGQILMRKQDILKILSPAESWVFSLTDGSSLTQNNLPVIAMEAFSGIEMTLYKALELDKVNIYRDDSLKAIISKKEAYLTGSYHEYPIRWKDTNDVETKRRMRLADSLSVIRGGQVYFPFDSALEFIDTVFYPFIPGPGMSGLRLSLKSSSQPFSSTFSLIAIAPTHLPIAGNIQLPRPEPIFWLKKDDALSLLSPDQRTLLGAVYAYGLKAHLDSSFNQYYEEEFDYGE